MLPNYYIACVKCNSKFTEKETITRCLNCGQSLDIIFDFSDFKENFQIENFRNEDISMKKYIDFFPLNKNSDYISLEEGRTPLVSANNLGKEYGIESLYIKNEGANPTGVFKDRGSFVEVSKAKELKAKGIVVASTGNMAASVSAYASKSKIPCYVIVPEGTPVGKLSQSIIYGGNVIKIRGTYTDCVALSEKMAKEYNYLLAGDYAFRSEGQKSIAFEIIEQLNWKVPDIVIAPVGCGTNLYGIAKGFFEWKEIGLINKIPKIIGVQPEKADTLYSSFYNNEDEYRFVKFPKSLCSAVNIGSPLDDMKLLKAIRQSKGEFEIIDDTSVLNAQKKMAKETSIFTEPSGAIPVACLKKLLDQGKIKNTDTIVCIATGNGLKDPYSATILFPKLPAINNSLSDLKDFLNSGILDMKTQKHEQKIIFSTLPSLEEIKGVLKKDFLFNFQKNKDIFKLLINKINYFFERKSQMKESELQVILDEVISEFNVDKKNLLEIIDYKGENFWNKKAKSFVKISFLNREYEACASGTGLVDASIKAIESVLNEVTDFKIKLLNYEVKVPSGGIDATVRVKIKCEDYLGRTLNTLGTSSDIVLASLIAYKKAFSILYNDRNNIED
jgi:threonine synthase